MRYFLLLLFLLPGFIQPSQAQRSFTTHPAAASDKRLALVMGNSAYPIRPLPNARNDAQDVAASLRALGFEVILKENLTKEAMETAISDFTRRLKDYAVGLFYFAGHGFMSSQKDNYLMSVEVRENLTEAFAKGKSVALEEVMGSMDEAKIPTKLLIIDACRNNPFRSWGRSDQKGLGAVTAPEGMVAFFAASPGEEAGENPAARNGLFTQELLKQLRAPGLELAELLRNTANQVKRLSPIQRPYRVGDLSDVFYFNPAAPKAQEPVAKTEPYTPPKREEPARSEPAMPNSKVFMDLPFADMAYVEGGTFQMGSNENDDEKPVHSVRVSSFYMSKYEITQRQWESVMGTNPSNFKDCADCPVESVSWEDVQEFLRKLNARTGGNYRLPTEAEWEYAAGGGESASRTKYAGTNEAGRLQDYGNFCDGNCDYSWKEASQNDGYKNTAPVGKYKPNALGLYDMSGNVWEWCNDWYGAYSSTLQTNPTGLATGPSRVLRGGSWSYRPANSRVAYRYPDAPSDRSNNVGFRVVSLQ
ncbi:MAG: SUMF1/EgtB/PvdO family nonheme iron enzyme [Spirosomataceae bacterium]